MDRTLLRRFGFREFWIERDRFVLNGAPVYLYGHSHPHFMTTAETGILKGIASAALAQEAEAEKRQQELTEAERAAEKRHTELSRRRDKLSSERLEAVAEAERVAKAMVEAFRRVQELAAAELAVRAEIGESGQGLSAEGLARRLSAYLSSTLKTLPRALDRRYGEIKLTNCASHNARDWSAAEQRATGTKPETGDDDADATTQN